MNYNIHFLVIVIFICSYILISNWKKLSSFKETFENSADIMSDLKFNTEAPTIDTSPEDVTFDSDGNVVTSYEKIDLQKKYEDILLSEDIVIDKDAMKTPQFEILDTIIKEKDNQFRAMQFENNEREVRPKPAPEFNSFKENYSKNLIEVPMQERSLNMATHRHQYNNKIDIDDPIQDAYLPYKGNNSIFGVKSVEQNNHEYVIISIFKEILDRNPTKVELEKYAKQFGTNDIDESILKINLINSVEYRRNVKLQSNEVAGDIEYEYAKKDLLYIVSSLYFQELEREIPKGMLLPLKDIWTYLQGNQYLFRAFLVDKNYDLFENEILELNLLTKANLSRLIDKYFILYELKLKANDIQRYDVLTRQSKNNVEPVGANEQTNELVSSQEKSKIETQSSTQTIYRGVEQKDDDTTGLYKKIEQEADKISTNNKIKYSNTDNLRFSEKKIQDIFKSAFSEI